MTSYRLPPSVDILGSFFPIWIFCLVAGLLLTLVIRLLLVRARLDAEIGPRVIIYPVWSRCSRVRSGWSAFVKEE
jgi:hypothetical protein